MSHLEANGAESSGDSDFVQVEVPTESAPIEPVPSGPSKVEEIEMASQADPEPVLEPEPSSEPLMPPSADSTEKLQRTGTSCRSMNCRCMYVYYVCVCGAVC